MNRKVQIVRFWMLALFALAWACFYGDPTLGIVPIAFFTGQASCFCCKAHECPLTCTSFPTTLTVTFSGMADAVCTDCEAYDGTYVVDTDILIGCTRSHSFNGPCEFAGTGSYVTTAFFNSGGDVHLAVELAIYCTASFGADLQRFDVLIGLGAPVDCTISSATNVPFQTSIACPTGGQRCDGSGVTCTVAP